MVGGPSDGSRPNHDPSYREWYPIISSEWLHSTTHTATCSDIGLRDASTYRMLRGYPLDMRRVVILGPGGSGKSTLAIRLSDITGLPLIELDKLFWRPGLAATPRDEWVKIQQQLVQENAWIMDGDLGPYDAVEVRLHASDTIIFLDFSPIRCAWRAIRRSRERPDFWLWLLRYRGQSRPFLMDAIAKYAAHATVHVLPNPVVLSRFIADVRSDYRHLSPAQGVKVDIQ